MATPMPLRHRVLMLAYYFPPHGGGGVQRTLKHIKYLPDEGFDPIVVTSHGWGYPIRDPELLKDIPASAVVLRAHSVPVQYARWKLEGLLRKLGLSVRAASLVGWPDEMVGWLPGAVHQALRAVRRYRPDVLYTTSSPVTSHVAGLVVQRLTNLPWVADFRDPWTLDVHVEREFALLRGGSAALERAVTARATRTVVVDESVELLGVVEGRMVVIRNGVDPDDLIDLPLRPPPGLFRLSYVGSLYGARDAAPVFTALRTLAERGAVDPAEFELRLVGDPAVAGKPDLAGLPVTETGYVDHQRALREMAEASALLFYAPAIARGSSGKIYEYLTTGRPVLCVARRDNLAYRLVEELGAGPCAHPEDGESIELAVQQLLRQWRNGGLTVDPSVRREVLRRFSRPALAAQLAGVLRAAIGGTDPPAETLAF
jgi:glycosyltransferase involved in cell wall biosynthesis